MAKKQTPPVAENRNADDIVLAKKIKIYLFHAILQANFIHASLEKDVLLNELRRALNATASLMARLGDKDAYADKSKK